MDNPVTRISSFWTDRKDTRILCREDPCAQKLVCDT